MEDSCQEVDILLEVHLALSMGDILDSLAGRLEDSLVDILLGILLEVHLGGESEMEDCVEMEYPMVENGETGLLWVLAEETGLEMACWVEPGCLMVVLDLGVRNLEWRMVEVHQLEVWRMWSWILGMGLQVVQRKVGVHQDHCEVHVEVHQDHCEVHVEVHLDHVEVHLDHVEVLLDREDLQGHVEVRCEALRVHRGVLLVHCGVLQVHYEVHLVHCEDLQVHYEDRQDHCEVHQDHHEVHQVQSMEVQMVTVLVLMMEDIQKEVLQVEDDCQELSDSLVVQMVDSLVLEDRSLVHQVQEVHHIHCLHSCQEVHWEDSQDIQVEVLQVLHSCIRVHILMEVHQEVHPASEQPC